MDTLSLLLTSRKGMLTLLAMLVVLVSVGACTVLVLRGVLPASEFVSTVITLVVGLIAQIATHTASIAFEDAASKRLPSQQGSSTAVVAMEPSPPKPPPAP